MTISLPELEGALVTDEATLTACARDYGRVVHRMPSAVLRPAAVRDVVEALRSCGGRIKPAALVVCGAEPSEAEQLLSQAGGNLRTALGRLSRGN